MMRRHQRANGSLDERPLFDAVFAWDHMHKYWDRLSNADQKRYVAWVGDARSQRQAQRRARTVHDRVLEGKGWAGPIRRFFESWIVPSSPTSGPDMGAMPPDFGAGTPGIH